MKVAIIGNTKLQYSWFVLTFKEGLKLNGHEVFEIDYRTTHIRDIKNKLIQIKPSIAFTHLTFHPIKPVGDVLNTFKDVNKVVGTKFIHILCDARHEPRYMGDISGAFHMAFVSQTHNLRKFKSYWNIPTFFCPYSAMTYNEMSPFAPDLAFQNPVFTGQPNAHPDRSKFIQQLQKIMPIEIFITQSKHDLRNRTPELSVSAKCILGLCTGYDIKHYTDVRPWQYLGTGAFMIMRKFNGIDDIIPDDLYIPFEGYNNPQVVKDLFEQWEDKDTMFMRKSAFDFIQTYHSSKVRMENIINVIEGKQDTVRAMLDEL